MLGLPWPAVEASADVEGRWGEAGVCHGEAGLEPRERDNDGPAGVAPACRGACRFVCYPPPFNGEGAANVSLMRWRRHWQAPTDRASCPGESSEALMVSSHVGGTDVSVLDPAHAFLQGAGPRRRHLP